MESDLISRQKAIERIVRIRPSTPKQSDYSHGVDVGMAMAIVAIEEQPSIEPGWNNHTVACLLADIFGDDCACNFNGIDEWLPEKCEVRDSCPHPVGVACWEQFLKYRKRKTDDCN